MAAAVRAGSRRPLNTGPDSGLTFTGSTFRDDAAQPYDDRCLSWQHDARTVSIWTTAGRLKAVPYVGNPDHLKTLREHRKGETDLIARDGKAWAVVNQPHAALPPQPVAPSDCKAAPSRAGR